MNLYWLLLNAVIAAVFGLLGALLATTLKRHQRARNASKAGLTTTPAVGTGVEPPTSPTAGDVAQLRVVLSRLTKQQELSEVRLRELEQPIAEAQRSEIDLLRRQVQQQLSDFRSKLERLEELLNKNRLQQAGGGTPGAGAGKRPQTPATAPAIGLLALEVNGLRKEYPMLASTRMTLGRAPSNDIVLQDMRLSETHVAFRSDESTAVVEPLGAANPVLLNGRRLVKPTTLKGGDVMSFSGNSRLTYTIAARREQPSRTPAVVLSGRQAKAG